VTTFTALALDPGGSTGWAMFRAQHLVVQFEGMERPIEEWNNQKFDSGQLVRPDHEGELETLLGEMHTTEFVIICESFVPRPAKFGADNKSSLKYISVVENFVKERNRDLPEHLQVQLTFQQAAQAKPFVKDRTIKRLGLWISGWKHAMDANRHLLFWMVKGPYKATLGRSLLEKGWKFE
jgi:hypothetical protein